MVLAVDGASLADFLAPLSPDVALRARTLAHAWEAAGGTLQPGRHSVRLLALDRQGRSFTAATLGASPPRLELARVLLHQHGVTPAQWQDWSDERPELAQRGFTPGAKFPAVLLVGLPDAALARLASGLRDLAALVGKDQSA